MTLVILQSEQDIPCYELRGEDAVGGERGFLLFRGLRSFGLGNLPLDHGREWCALESIQQQKFFLLGQGPV